MFTRIRLWGSLTLGFLLSYLDFRSKRFRRKCARTSDIVNFIADVNLTLGSSPERISDILRSNFTYRKDKRHGAVKFNFAKHPKVFFTQRYGDCDDFSLFTEYILNLVGFLNVSRVYVMTAVGAGHVVCVAKVGKYHYAFGNWPALVLSSNDLKDVGKIIARGMNSTLDFAVRARYNCITEFHLTSEETP